MFQGVISFPGTLLRLRYTNGSWENCGAFYCFVICRYRAGYSALWSTLTAGQGHALHLHAVRLFKAQECHPSRITVSDRVACSVVLPGRAFLRRLIDLTIGISRPQHLINLTQSVKSDMRTWLAFLSNFNGSSFFLTRNWITSPSLQLYTDASGSFGYGAVFQD